jgi:hypothetical protein
MVGGLNTIIAITSEPLDRSTANWRHFVHGVNAFNSRYIIIVNEVKMTASHHLDFGYIFIVTKLLKLTI